MSTLRLCLLSLLVPVIGNCQSNEKAMQPPPSIIAVRDLNYAGTQNWRQTMDVFVPKTPPEKALPLIVFIHGGGWEAGSKNMGGALFALIQDGAYIGASLNYRLTNEGQHPVQIHDCKGAIRWLRAHAKDYNIDKDKIGVFGISAGGHLVSLLGVSGDVKELEGTVGGNLDQSSRVNCVANFCGPADFLTFGAQGSVINPEDEKSPVGKLIGGKVSERKEVAIAASPITYVTKDDAPFLHIHGTADPLVPYAQPKEFEEKLKAAGVPTAILTGEKGGHVFFSPELVKDLRTFFDHHLYGKPGDVKEGPVAIK